MRIRWDKDKRNAMESTLMYADEIERDRNLCYSVHAGLEPESFIEMFPYWVLQDDITDLQLDEGLGEDQVRTLISVLNLD